MKMKYVGRRQLGMQGGHGDVTEKHEEYRLKEKKMQRRGN